MAQTTTSGDLILFPHFQPALDGIQPPLQPFDPAGAWTNTYELWLCVTRHYSIGALRLQREPLSADLARLTVTFRKRATWGALRASARLECLADALATPRRWTVETWSEDQAGKVIPETRLTETAELAGGVLATTVGQQRREEPLAGPVAHHWGLLEAVQRLSPQAEPLSFTLVDRLSSQLKPGQTLSYRGEVEVGVGGRKVWREEAQPLEVGTVYRPVADREGDTRLRLRVYQQWGEGILPTTYWVDERGRLQYVFSGILALVLNPKVTL